MMTASPGRSTVYELTVVGTLGPVLRTALEPCRSSGSEEHTILRIRAQEDRDLVDLVQALRQLGLEVTSLSALA